MPGVDIRDILAIIAIIVSLITYIISRRAALSLEARQQSFELRVYTLTMLDPARGTLQRILSDINRILNAAVVGTQDGGSRGLSSEDRAALGRLDKEAVDTFNAIDHHVPRDKRQVLEQKRATLEKKWVELDNVDPREVHEYTESMLRVIEVRLRVLLGTD